MINIGRHNITLSKIPSDDYLTRTIGKITTFLSKIGKGEDLNLYNFKKRPLLLARTNILNSDVKNLSSYILLYLDFGLAHFERTLGVTDLKVNLNNKEYYVSSLNDYYGADYFDWFNLYIFSSLLNDEGRMEKIVKLDVESINPDNRSYWWVAYQYFKAYAEGDERNIYNYRERAEAYANEGKTFFVGVEESKNIKMRETPKLKYIWYPIIELFYLVYFNKEEEFNTYLGEYLASKKQWIIDNKEEDNSLFWIDFPSLAACAEAHRKGFKITVESDYIPAWVYRGEYT